MSELWVGTSGYVYPHWRRGVFYPVGLRQRDELAFYARHFSTVELNNPFYRLPGPDRVKIEMKHEDLKQRAGEVRQFLKRLA